MPAAAWADGRWRGTTLALLLCVAAVFTKQSLVSAGIAIAITALIRRPRDGAIATTIAAVAGAAVLLALQWLTAGGFLQNVLGYNLVRAGWSYAADVFQAPNAPSLPFAGADAGGLRRVWRGTSGTSGHQAAGTGRARCC